MKIVGIISEYNPFHTGHAYHLHKAREAANCDFVVAVMSGAFTQRGEPALLDKWVRTEMALHCGVDLVIELPAYFAIQSADRFALGGIRLLGSLGAVDSFAFGCEMDDLKLLKRAALILEEEPPAFYRAMRARLDEGMSHARARGEALSEALYLAPDAFKAPNTALALEYLRANQALEKPMTPILIKRTGGYHDKTLSQYASATAIRHALSVDDLKGALTAMPEPSARILERHWPEDISDNRRLDDLLLYALRRADAAQLRALPDISEGLEMRIKRCAMTATSREELLLAVKCKRYPMARLMRIMTHAMLDMRRALLANYTVPPYARVLGFKKSASPLLKALDVQSSIPLITDPVRIREHPLFELENQVTDLWGLSTDAPHYRTAGRDYTERIVIVE